MAKSTQQVATTDETPTNQALVDASAYEQYAGSGFENQTSDDYAIPFLQVLQGLSPQLQENDDLKQGMIINTVTGESFSAKDGIAFVPATTSHLFVEWKPRDAGGGFVGTHEVNSEIVKHCVDTQDFGKFTTPEGNDLIETFYVYGVAIMPDGESIQAVLAFSSTKIKKYKAWMTKAKTIQIDVGNGRRIPAPLFAHRYRLKTVSEKNTKGQFFNWDIGFDGPNALACRIAPSDPAFQAAVGIKELLDSGKARAAYESQTPGSGDDAEGGASSDKPRF